MEPQKVAHVGMWKRKLIRWPLRPFDDSGIIEGLTALERRINNLA